MTTEVDGLYICPYNKSHMVEWHKLPNHLVRCRKNNPDLAERIIICPYNYCHHVFKEEMEMHLKDCRDHHSFKATSLKPASCESLSRKLMQRAQQENEQLQYNGYRNNFVGNTNGSAGATTDSYAMKQHQKNMDDLDEWFVE